MLPPIQKLKKKNYVAANPEINSEKCIAADSKINSENIVAADPEIGSDGEVFWTFFFVFTETSYEVCCWNGKDFGFNHKIMIKIHESLPNIMVTRKPMVYESLSKD
jgi:hypothetical protein